MNEGRPTPTRRHPPPITRPPRFHHTSSPVCPLSDFTSVLSFHPSQSPAATSGLHSAPSPVSSAHQASNVVTSACWKHSGCAHHICRQLITAHPTPRPRFPYEEVHLHLLTVERAGGRKPLWSQRGLRMHARYDLRWLSQLESRLVCVKHASSPYPVVQCRRRDIGRAAETC